MSCKSSIYYWSMVLLPAFTGCGMLENMTQTLKEVKLSNKNQAELIEQGKGMGQRMDTMIALSQGMEKKMDESIAGVNASLEEVKKSNGNMETLIGQGKGMHERMDTLVHQGQAMGGKLDESIQGVKDSLAEVKKSNSNMETLIGQGKGMHDRMDVLVAQGKALGAKMDESLAEVIRTRQATEKMLEKVGEQEHAIIRDTMASLAVVVGNPDFENHYRIASAKTIYRLLIEKNLDAAWYSAFVAANFEMCKPHMKEPYGELCTDKYYGKPGRKATLYDKFKTFLERVAEKTGGFPKVLISKVVQLGDSLADQVPLTPLRPNVIWAISLRPDLIPEFYKHLVADRKNPQNHKAAAFLAFAQETLLSSLHAMAVAEERGETLATFKLEAFRERKELVQTISQLPGFQSGEADQKLKGDVARLVGAASARALSEEDKEILRKIQEGGAYLASATVTGKR